MNIPTVAQIVVRITVTIAFVEFAIMASFVNAPIELSPYAKAVLDTVLLVVLSTPVIYAWIIKPYIAAHKELVHQIEDMAHYDPLTKLANRRLLSEYIEKVLPDISSKKSTGAILFIDLDGFKAINDSYGHDAGDEILINVAKHLKSFVRSGDIVGRVGGDEFVMILSQLDVDEQVAKNEAIRISERIQEALSNEVKYKDKSLQVSSSIGIRILIPEQTSVESALKDADTAMYSAKEAGRGKTVVFNDSANNTV